MVHDSVEERQMVNMLKKVKVTHPVIRKIKD